MVRITRKHIAITSGLIGLGFLLYALGYDINQFKYAENPEAGRWWDTTPLFVIGYAFLILIPFILKQYFIGIVLFLITAGPAVWLSLR